MKNITLYELFWGILSHTPLITIIWFGYVMYHCWIGHSLSEFVTDFHVHDMRCIPVVPVILTLASAPIAFSIRAVNKKSVFVSQNAQEAYTFSLWILYWYMLFFLLAVFGFVLSIQSILLFVQLMGLVTTVFCLTQALMGVYSVTRRRVYTYWYPPFLSKFRFFD